MRGHEWREYPKLIGELMVDDADEERIASDGDQDNIETVRQRIYDHRAARQRTEAVAVSTAVREFPKWIDGPDGPVIMHSTEEEADLRQEAAERASEAIAFRPTPEVRLMLGEAAKGRDISEVLNEMLFGAPAAVSRSVGRPSSWRPEFAGQASKLCRLGATAAQLADFFEVDERTIKRWQDSKPEFANAVAEARSAG